MSDYCQLFQRLCAEANFSTENWRNDVILPQPRLLGPRDGQVVCLDWNPLGVSAIQFSWEPVPGATVYLVQWGNNPQLSGPTVREAIVAAPQTFYLLIDSTDVRNGEKIYWRVIAGNNVDGGVSAKSETRSIEYSCGDQQNNNDESTDFDVYCELQGPEYLRCCDRATYGLFLSYTCKDQLDRQLVNTEDVVWSYQSFSGDTDGSLSIDPGQSNIYQVEVETCFNVTQIITLIATVTFKNELTGETFEKQCKKKIMVDCADPKYIELTQDPDCIDKLIALDGQFDDIPLRDLNPECPYPPIEVPVDTADDCTRPFKLTGPVFKNLVGEECCGIVSDCCDCVPREIPTTITIGTGDYYVLLVHDEALGTWSAPDQLIGGRQFCGIELVCSGTDWLFSFTRYKEGCLKNVDGDIVPNNVNVVVDGPNGQDIQTLTYNPETGLYEGGQVNVNQLDTSLSNSFFDYSYDPVLDEIQYTLGQTPITETTGTQAFTDGVGEFGWVEIGGGDDVNLNFEVEDPDPCDDPLIVNHTFTFCEDPFFGSVTLPNPSPGQPDITVTFGTSECSSCEEHGLTKNVDKVTLEARPEGSLGCGLWIDSKGRLAVNPNSECCYCPDSVVLNICNQCYILEFNAPPIVADVSCCCECSSSQVTDYSQSTLTLSATCIDQVFDKKTSIQVTGTIECQEFDADGNLLRTVTDSVTQTFDYVCAEGDINLAMRINLVFPIIGCMIEIHPVSDFAECLETACDPCQEKLYIRNINSCADDVCEGRDDFSDEEQACPLEGDICGGRWSINFETCCSSLFNDPGNTDPVILQANITCTNDQFGFGSYEVIISDPLGNFPDSAPVVFTQSCENRWCDELEFTDYFCYEFDDEGNLVSQETLRIKICNHNDPLLDGDEVVPICAEIQLLENLLPGGEATGNIIDGPYKGMDVKICDPKCCNLYCLGDTVFACSYDLCKFVPAGCNIQTVEAKVRERIAPGECGEATVSLCLNLITIEVCNTCDIDIPAGEVIEVRLNSDTCTWETSANTCCCLKNRISILDCCCENPELFTCFNGVVSPVKALSLDISGCCPACDNATLTLDSNPTLDGDTVKFLISWSFACDGDFLTGENTVEMSCSEPECVAIVFQSLTALCGDTFVLTVSNDPDETFTEAPCVCAECEPCDPTVATDYSFEIGPFNDNAVEFVSESYNVVTGDWSITVRQLAPNNQVEVLVGGLSAPIILTTSGAPYTVLGPTAGEFTATTGDLLTVNGTKGGVGVPVGSGVVAISFNNQPFGADTFQWNTTGCDP